MEESFVIRGKNSWRAKEESKHEIIMTPKGHRVIRGHCDLLYDLKFHDDFCVRFDLVYDPKSSGVIRGRRDLLYDTKGHSDICG